MHLLRFKCKTTGRTYQERAGGSGCDGCAFHFSKAESEEGKVQVVLYKHCLGVGCINRQTIFVEVTE